MSALEFFMAWVICGQASMAIALYLDPRAEEVICQPPYSLWLNFLAAIFVASIQGAVILPHAMRTLVRWVLGDGR